MSDTTEDRAALYVLGVLDADEMRSVRSQATRDAAFAAEITGWEQRLFPLAALAGEITPPETIWIDITNRLDAMVRSMSTALPLPRRQPGTRPATGRAPRTWRVPAIAATAVAAGLAAVLILQPFAPKPGVVAPVPPPVVAMVLPAGSTSGGFLVEVAANGTLHATGQGVSHAPDRDFELWAMPDGGTKPLKLGVLPLPAAELHPPALPAGHYRLLVSLEPKGGSPTDLPTGPVVFASSLL